MSEQSTVDGFEEDGDVHFAVAPNDGIYITRSTKPTLYAESPYKTFHPVHWGALEVHARHIICERVESSILKVVFPELKLSGNSEESIWALFKDHIGLYHVATKRLVKVTSPGNASVDGPVSISPQHQPQSPSGAIEDATTFMRLKRSIVLVERFRTIRILNLETWTLSTLVTSPVGVFSVYPASASATPLPFIASEDFVTIETASESLSLDLKTGKTSDPSKLSLHGHSYACFFPIPSSSNAPTYLARHGGPSLIRVVNGMAQRTKRIRIAKSHHAVHIASIGLSLISSTLNKLTTVLPIRTKWELLQAPAPPRLKRFDLSSLINNDHFPRDLTIKHGSQEWNLPLEVVKDLYPSFDGLELNKLIKPFPSSSVEALIGRMLGKPLPDALCIDSCRIWSHVIYLWRAIDAQSSPVLNNFKSSALPSLPDPVACDVLMALWNDTTTNWTEHDPFVLSLTRHIKKNCFKTFSKLLLSQISLHNVALSLSMVELLVEDEAAAAIKVDDTGLTAKHLEKTPVPENGELEALLVKPTDFLFTFDTADDPYVVVGDTRYLYTRWRWFKRLIDSGSEEAKKRTAKMPDWMSSTLLLAIVGHVHEEWFNEVLSVSDALELLEHRREFDICDADDEPVAPFVALYDHCMTVVFHEVSRDNVLEQMANYQRLGMDSKVGELLSLVVSGQYQFDGMKLLKALPVSLLEKLKSEAARLDE